MSATSASAPDLSAAPGETAPAAKAPRASHRRSALRHDGERARWRGRRRFGTATRLAAFHALVLVIILGAVVFLLVRQFTSSYQSVAARALAGEMKAYTSAASAAVRTTDLKTFTVGYLQSRALPAGTALVVSFPGNQVVVTPDATRLLDDPQLAAWLRTAPTSSVAKATHVDGTPTEVLVAPLVVEGQRTGTFLAATDLSAQESQRSRVLRLSIAEAGIALLAGVASAYLLLRRLLHTIGRITRAAEQIGSGALDRRLGDQGSDDEVGQLAATFDSMIGRIDAAMTAQRRLLSDVSHQLRTPLTVARGHLEVLEHTGEINDPAAVSETVALVVDELEHMRSLVERLLLLGRAMEPDFLAMVLIDARDFVAEIFDAAQVLAPRQWSMGEVPDLVVSADAAKLRGALLNLVDNAVKATEPGDRIEISCSTDDVDQSIVFAVEDSGPGIPEHERAAVLARFSRPGARDEDGTGLGLAIVRAVADAHGGQVSVGESHLGGARIAIVLPGGLVRSIAEV